MVAAGNRIILLGLDSGKMDVSRLFLLNVIILSVLKQYPAVPVVKPETSDYLS